MTLSVMAYIRKLSTQRLLDFLEQCRKNDEWFRYAHVIPDIILELTYREVTIPKEVMQSWNQYWQKRNHNL